MESRATNAAQRDLRTLRTRRLILDALHHLLATHAFRDITVRDIIQQAQINRTTFYRHYQDKYDLVESTLRNDIERTIAALEEETRDLSRLNLNQAPAAWVALFEHLAGQKPFYQATLGQSSALSFADYAAGLLAGVSRARLQRLYPQRQPNSIPDDVVTRFVISALMGVVRWWLEDDTPHPPRAIANWLFLLITQGTLASLGRPGAGTNEAAA